MLERMEVSPRRVRANSQPAGLLDRELVKDMNIGCDSVNVHPLLSTSGWLYRSVNPFSINVNEASLGYCYTYGSLVRGLKVSPVYRYECNSFTIHASFGVKTLSILCPHHSNIRKLHCSITSTMFLTPLLAYCEAFFSATKPIANPSSNSTVLNVSSPP